MIVRIARITILNVTSSRHVGRWSLLTEEWDLQSGALVYRVEEWYLGCGQMFVYTNVSNHHR